MQEAKFKVGDVVKLKIAQQNGIGWRMLVRCVVGTPEFENTYIYNCCWHDKDGRPVSEDYQEALLIQG